MKLHKKFIDELGLQRKATVGKIIANLGILTIKNNSIQDLHDNLDQLEQIFYTVDYLLEKELVIQEDYRTGSYVPDFNPINFVKNREKEDYRTSRIHAMPRYLQQYWGREFLVRPSYFKMIKNGYKTDKEKIEHRNFWLPISLAILAAFLTGLFTKIFDILI